jgi:hypothetical protein
MRSPLLLLLALSVHSAALTLLDGPTAIFACGTYNFSWTNGTSPYTFHPLVGTDAANATPLAEIVLANPLISYHVEERAGEQRIACRYCSIIDTVHLFSQGTALQIFVADAAGDTSNTLSAYRYADIEKSILKYYRLYCARFRQQLWYQFDRFGNPPYSYSKPSIGRLHTPG